MMKRTHTCGDLKKSDLNKEIVLCGWVHSRRDHGGLVFIDLRDRYGLTQVVFDPNHNPEAHKTAEKLRREWVIEIAGKVRKRPEGMTNPKMATGDVEVITHEVTILNESETPPLEIEDKIDVSDDFRLKYRYIDLRRPTVRDKIVFRHKVAQAVREYLASQDFLEIETPMLLKTTPGGARVFKVPSRVAPGKFYALPESPQMYKQLLMVAGFDRYFQLARCLRDEDLRADRQPEFTQIDLEMSFVEPEDVQTIVEGTLKHAFKKTLNINIQTPFRRIPYIEAMSKYGSDKPDFRFGLEFVEVTDIAKHSDFGVFKSAVKQGGVVYGLTVPGGAKFSRKEIDELEEVAKTYHLPGLCWAKVVDNKLESSVAKYLSKTVQDNLIKKGNAKNGDLLLYVAHKFKTAVTALGAIRLFLGNKLKLINEKEFCFCWVVDFPLYEWNETEERWDAAHHIFTMPKEEDMRYLEENPSKVRGKLYDVVLNGVEIGGGSIRVHRKDTQIRCLKVIGLEYEEAEKKFDFLLNAFKYGAPPHGGLALGFDRVVALMCGSNDIREVIAFPRNKAMENPMDSSPQEWTPDFLKELHLKLDIAKKKPAK
ncbi:MAG: aspartate--tRNA ligase [Nanoarchaeota archaeon]|nr:aspartate--tRNA ligase [Nanoarchaeota archaeon]